jgi:hypothetical protein
MDNYIILILQLYKNMNILEKFFTYNEIYELCNGNSYYLNIKDINDEDLSYVFLHLHNIDCLSRLFRKCINYEKLNDIMKNECLEQTDIENILNYINNKINKYSSFQAKTNDVCEMKSNKEFILRKYLKYRNLYDLCGEVGFFK